MEQCPRNRVNSRYRIDLVVEGMVGHIAVECDGDHWHGPDRYEQDAARQRDLERCGRVFYRIRGSAFSVDPEGALDGLWKTLDRHGVLPGAARPTSDTATPDSSPHDDDSRQTVSDTVSLVANQSEPPLESDDGVTALSANTPGGRLRSEHQYQEWRAVSLPDPAAAATADVVAGLVSIIEHEGPMTVHRACRLYIKASGGQRVGKNDRSYLHRAVRRAAQQGLIVLRNETEVRDMDEHIARRAGSPLMSLRCRGQREFSEIPSSEIAAVLQELACRHPGLVGGSLYREVLVFYETRRMTSNIEDRLKWIEERRAFLLTESAPTGPSPTSATDPHQ